MKRKRFYIFNRWVDFSYYSGAFRVGYGRNDLYVKTLLFWQWKRLRERPSMILDNLGIDVDIQDGGG